MSLQPYQNPTTAAFRGGYSAQPSGLAEPHEHVDTSVDSRAWTAFTLGLLSLVVSVLAGIPAILVGLHSLRRIKADPALKGRRLAWAGVLLGCVSVLAVGPLLYWANH